MYTYNIQKPYHNLFITSAMNIKKIKAEFISSAFIILGPSRRTRTHKYGFA